MTALRQRMALPLIAALALASSAVGIVNRFTYDDRYIIQLDPAMRSMAGWWRVFGTSYWPKDWGGEGYRPLTMLAFRIQAVLSGVDPTLFHAVNIALYAVASVLVFALAKRVLPQWAAWVCAAMFAVHPVHVEAVANVVGQAELIVGVAVVVATLLYLRDRERGHLRPRTTAIVALLYAAACFAKEHGIVLPALLIAAELTVIADVAPWRERVRRLRPTFLLLTAIALGFVGLRAAVLADHGIGGFQPFTPFSTLQISNRDRMLTALGVVPHWVRLLFWPAHLSSEYGPPEIEIAQGPSLIQLPGLLVLVTVLGVGIALRRRQPVISFGVAFTAITLLPSSNFVLPAGIVLAERTLFLPSVGAMLILGAAAVYMASVVRTRLGESRLVVAAAASVCAAILAVGATRSAARTRVWKDNDRLFRQAVIDSPRAYRAHFMLGAWAFENARKREGEAEFRKALNLFPYDPSLSYNMAEQYRLANKCSAAIPLYKWTYDVERDFPLGRSMYAWCLLERGRYQEGRFRALDAMRYGADVKFLRTMIAYADSVKSAHDKNFSKGSPTLIGATSKLPDSLQKAGRRSGGERSEY